MLVCGHADNGPDVRSQLRTRGHPPANPRGRSADRTHARGCAIIIAFFDHAQNVCERGGKQDGANEFGYEKQSRVAVAEWISDLQDTEASRKRRNYGQ